MSINREIVREVWNGKLPICFRLHPDEVSALKEPEPIYLLVPRISYFPLVIDKVRKHFGRFSIRSGDNSKDTERDVSGDIWLEFNGQPLKWNYPIGVLFDNFHDCDSLTTPTTSSLPWTITVRFKQFPEKKLFRFKTKEVFESFFMSSIKEADVLKHKKTVFSNLQKRDSNQLWTGLLNDKFDQFWSMNNRLMEKEDGEFFKYVPVRCYVTDDPDQRYTQILFVPNNSNGQPLSLIDFLNECFPDRTIVKAQTHGITLELNEQLQWLSENLSYADNFLHIIVTISSELKSD